MAVRKSDLAGSWYPGDERQCVTAIEEFMRDGVECPRSDVHAVGGIVPHAGWYFSGAIACNVINCLSRGQAPDTCIIFGRHLHPRSGNYIMTEGSWATPLGEVAIDAELAERVRDEFECTVETPSRYEQDNTIELQLPFIKYFLPDTMIVPIGVPPADASVKLGQRVVELAAEAGRTVVVLGSTDLTHYGYNYGTVHKGVGEKALEWVRNVNDKQAVDLMCAMDTQGVIREALRNQNACCAGAAAAAIGAASALGAAGGQTLLYATSYDVRPDTSFVGYVGILYYPD